MALNTAGEAEKVMESKAWAPMRSCLHLSTTYLAGLGGYKPSSTPNILIRLYLLLAPTTHQSVGLI